MMSCSGRQVYLIGTKTIQNETLVQLLADKTGANCALVPELWCVPLESDNSGHKKLVLYDFSSRSESIDDLIESDKNDILNNDYLVLINLPPTFEMEVDALHCGVRGFLYCHEEFEIMLRMVHAVLNSELWISRELISKILQERPPKRGNALGNPTILSRREVEILNAVTDGLTNAMIANTYCLSPHTVKTHIYHIFKKIKVSNRIQAANWASLNL